VRCQDYLAVGKLPIILKQQQQHWKIDMMLWGFAERIEQPIKMGKIEGSTMDSRTVKRVESEDDSQLRNLGYFA
jgi:hypothetical protein